MSELNIDRVIAFLEAENGLKFDMSIWLDPDERKSTCGTAACIGGVCDLLQTLQPDGTFTPEFNCYDPVKWITEGVQTKAPRLNVFYGLFHPSEDDVAEYWEEDPAAPGYITREHAIACLKHFRDTGEIDWEGTKP